MFNDESISTYEDTDHTGISRVRPTAMSADTIAIITTVITVGILLFGATAAMFQMQYKRMDSIDNRIGSLENRITAFEQRVENRFIAFETRFSTLEQRQARLEGMMEGIIEMLSRAPQSA